MFGHDVCRGKGLRICIQVYARATVVGHAVDVVACVLGPACLQVAFFLSSYACPNFIKLLQIRRTSIMMQLITVAKLVIITVIH